MSLEPEARASAHLRAVRFHSSLRPASNAPCAIFLKLELVFISKARWQCRIILRSLSSRKVRSGHVTSPGARPVVSVFASYRPPQSKLLVVTGRPHAGAKVITPQFDHDIIHPDFSSRFSRWRNWRESQVSARVIERDTLGRAVATSWEKNSGTPASFTAVQNIGCDDVLRLTSSIGRNKHAINRKIPRRFTGGASECKSGTRLSASFQL